MVYVYPGEKIDLGGNRGWLDRAPAQSIWRIDSQIGHRLQITEAGRTWAQQMAHWLTYQRNGYPIALHPDTPSLHQKGHAVDTNEGQRIHSRMEANGWRRTVYRWVNGKWTLVEPWHYEYFAQYDKYYGQLASGGAVPLPLPKPETAPVIGADDMIAIKSPGRQALAMDSHGRRPLNDEQWGNFVGPRFELNDRQYDLAVEVYSTTQPWTELRDSFIGRAPNRPWTLFAPGYIKVLNDEELSNQPFSTRRIEGNDRQYDLWASVAIQGATVPVTVPGAPSPTDIATAVEKQLSDEFALIVSKLDALDEPEETEPPKA